MPFVREVTHRRVECLVLGHKLSHGQGTAQNSSPPSYPTQNSSTILMQQFTPFHIVQFDASHCNTLAQL